MASNWFCDETVSGLGDMSFSCIKVTHSAYLELRTLSDSFQSQYLDHVNIFLKICLNQSQTIKRFSY